MASTDVIIRILADTSGAQGNVDRLIESMDKALPLGAAGVAGGAMLKTAVDFQTSMAGIQAAYNSADFAPGTARFEEVHNKLVDWSTRLATPFSTLAETYGQGARFLDQFGNKLSPDKLDEYTESVTRLSKVSKDLDPTRAGQLVETLAKVYSTTNFAGITSAATALSGIHNMGEGPALEGAIAIGQAGAEIGIRPEQALGISNALVDVGMSGTMGSGGMGAAGGSILRQAMQMQASADSILDPEVAYAEEKKQRTAGERVDDLQTNLDIAEAKRSEMFDSRGRLKRNYLRHPSEKMAEDARIAKMQRDLGDARTDQQHLGDGALGRGKMDIRAMAQTAGMDVDDYAELTKSDPTEALLDFTRAVGKLPEDQRGAALRKAGLKNRLDLKLDEVLAGRDDVIRQSIGIAGDQLKNPTDLTSRSNIPLGTTAAKAQNALDAGQAGLAAAGEQPRQLADAGLDQFLGALHDNSDSLKHMSDVLTGDSMFDHIVGGVVAGGLALLTATVPSIIIGVLTGKAIAGAAAGATGAATGGATAAAAGVTGTSAATAGGAVLGLGGAVAAAGTIVPALGEAEYAERQRADLISKGVPEWLATAATPTIPGAEAALSGAKSINDATHALPSIDIGGININAGKDVDVAAVAQQAAQHVYDQIIAAWNHTKNAPSPQVGGAI